MAERRINVRGIIYKDGKILAQKFSTKSGGETEYWGTPGGGLNGGESIVDGLRREIVEETGIIPAVGDLACVHQFLFKRHDNTEREQLELFFMITNPNEYEHIDLSSTSHGLAEITQCGFIDPTKENVLPTFLRTMDFETISGSAALIDSEL